LDGAIGAKSRVSKMPDEYCRTGARPQASLIRQAEGAADCGRLLGNDGQKDARGAVGTTAAAKPRNWRR
jgi:hypothetical protein